MNAARLLLPPDHEQPTTRPVVDEVAELLRREGHLPENRLAVRVVAVVERHATGEADPDLLRALDVLQREVAVLRAERDGLRFTVERYVGKEVAP